MGCMFACVLDVVTVVSASVGIWAVVNTTYRCFTPTTFAVGGAAVTFSNVRLEAYMPGNDLSATGTRVAAAVFSNECVCNRRIFELLLNR